METALAAISALFVLLTALCLWLIRQVWLLRYRTPGKHAVAVEVKPAPTNDEPDVKDALIAKLEADLRDARNESLAMVGDLRRQLAEADANATLRIQRSEALAERQAGERIAAIRQEYTERRRAENKASNARSRTALVAKIGEHLAPLFEGFKYNLKDVRHVGEIFDFLVFDGLEEGEIRQVVFLEVKTKRSGARVTNPREKMLRDAVENGRVSYDIYVPPVNGSLVMRTCSVVLPGGADCPKKHYALGFCRPHYYRKRRYGDPGFIPDITQDGNPNWSEVPGYRAKHGRVRRAYGKASEYECENCEKQASDWAMLHDTNGEDIDDFIPLCRSCHCLYDDIGRHWRVKSPPHCSTCTCSINGGTNGRPRRRSVRPDGDSTAD
jgi:predicted Holliday junction resolvase-like endonuclease